MHAEITDPTQHDRFVVTRHRRATLSPTLDEVDVYEFLLADGDVDAPPFCHVRQRVSRSTVRIGFYADKASTVALMHLNMRPRFDPWERCELVDDGMHTIGEIQKVFVPRRRRSHYLLYGGDGDEIARVEALVSVAVGRRRVGRLAAAVTAGVLGIPIIGAAGVAIVSLAVGVGLRQLRDSFDPLDVASELRILRGEQLIGVIRRLVSPGTLGPGTPTIPLPWRSPTSVFEIDMTADHPTSVDRRIVLAVPVALDTLRGVFAS